MSEQALHNFGRPMDMDACAIGMAIVVIATLKVDVPDDFLFEGMIIGRCPESASTHPQMITASARSAAAAMAERALRDALGCVMGLGERDRERVGEVLADHGLVPERADEPAFADEPADR